MAVKMSESSIADLSDMLSKVGEAARKLDNGYDLLARIKSGELDAKGLVEKLLALWKQYKVILKLNEQEHEKKMEAIKAGIDAENAYTSISDPAVLAVRLLGHDEVHATTIMNSDTSALIYFIKTGNNGYTEEVLNSELLFPCYEVTRIYTTAIPYLATGRQELLVTNPAAKLPELMALTGTHLAPASYKLEGVDSVFSDEHIAMYQLLRNASTHLQDEEINAPIDISIEDFLSEGVPMRVLKVADAGLGIHPEVLPKLFGTYSSKPHGGGLGLRIVKRIADLRDGRVEVTSTQRDGKTFRYSTATDSLSSPELLSRGTIFELYLKALQPAAI